MALSTSFDSSIFFTLWELDPWKSYGFQQAAEWSHQSALDGELALEHNFCFELLPAAQLPSGVTVIFHVSCHT